MIEEPAVYLPEQVPEVRRVDQGAGVLDLAPEADDGGLAECLEPIDTTEGADQAGGRARAQARGRRRRRRR